MAFLVTADGRTIDVKGELPNGKFGLAQMQKLVGGYIELVPCETDEGQHVYCDEEGKLKGKPYNRIATELANWQHDPLVGDVLFLTPGEENSDDD